MESSVIIKSAQDGSTLEFSGFGGGHYTITLSGSKFSGAANVYAYEPSLHLKTFFQDLALNWRGWKGKKEWSSLEAEFKLSATTDSKGHTSLSVHLRSGPDAFDWSLSTTLLIEAGQLEQIAERIGKFFAL